MPRKGKAVGYIVECQGLRAMCVAEWHRFSRLYFGQYVTLFPNRYRAQEAIRRTRIVDPGFETQFGKLKVTRVRPFLSDK